MSLLVINSSSKLAQGLVKHFHQTQKFEKIICADLYPSYDRILSYCDMKSSMEHNPTSLTDVKYQDK